MAFLKSHLDVVPPFQVQQVASARPAVLGARSDDVNTRARLSPRASLTRQHHPESRDVNRLKPSILNTRKAPSHLYNSHLSISPKRTTHYKQFRSNSRHEVFYMRPSTRLLLTTTTKRNITTTFHRQAVKMSSAPGIPSSTPLQPQSKNQHAVPSQDQGLTQTSPLSTSTPVGTAVASGTGATGGVGGNVGGSEDAASYGITSTALKTAPGVELSARQKVIVGGVLDVSHSFNPFPMSRELLKGEE